MDLTDGLVNNLVALLSLSSGWRGQDKQPLGDAWMPFLTAAQCDAFLGEWQRPQEAVDTEFRKVQQVWCKSSSTEQLVRSAPLKPAKRTISTWRQGTTTRLMVSSQSRTSST